MLSPLVHKYCMLTRAKTWAALGYAATWFSVVSGLVGSGVCPPDIILTSSRIPGNYLPPINSIIKFWILGLPSGCIWAIVYYRAILLRAFSAEVQRRR